MFLFVLVAGDGRVEQYCLHPMQQSTFGYSKVLPMEETSCSMPTADPWAQWGAHAGLRAIPSLPSMGPDCRMAAVPPVAKSEGATCL